MKSTPEVNNQEALSEPLGLCWMTLVEMRGPPDSVRPIASAIAFNEAVRPDEIGAPFVATLKQLAGSARTNVTAAYNASVWLREQGFLRRGSLSYEDREATGSKARYWYQLMWPAGAESCSLRPSKVPSTVGAWWAREQLRKHDLRGGSQWAVIVALGAVMDRQMEGESCGLADVCNLDPDTLAAAYYDLRGRGVLEHYADTLAKWRLFDPVVREQLEEGGAE